MFFFLHIPKICTTFAAAFEKKPFGNKPVGKDG